MARGWRQNQFQSLYASSGKADLFGTTFWEFTGQTASRNLSFYVQHDECRKSKQEFGGMDHPERSKQMGEGNVSRQEMPRTACDSSAMTVSSFPSTRMTVARENDRDRNPRLKIRLDYVALRGRMKETLPEPFQFYRVVRSSDRSGSQRDHRVYGLNHVRLRRVKSTYRCTIPASISDDCIDAKWLPMQNRCPPPKGR